jgi:hypothetical protein
MTSLIPALFGLAIIGFFYLLPSLVATWSRHRNTAAISVLNVFLGWTLLGWIIALIWASTSNCAPRISK